MGALIDLLSISVGDRTPRSQLWYVERQNLLEVEREHRFHHYLRL